MKKILFILAAVFSLIIPNAAFSGDLALVQSEGTAAKSEDIADVKRRAIDDALKNAVADALKSMLARESMGAPAQAVSAISSSPRAYVVNYKIKSEGWVTHIDGPSVSGPNDAAQGTGTELYHIWLEASIDSDALRGAAAKTLSAAADSGQYTINILGVKDYPTFRLLYTSIQKIALIKDLSYSSFSNERIVLMARAGGSLAALTERIAQEVPDKFAVMEGAGQIIIRPLAGQVSE